MTHTYDGRGRLIKWVDPENFPWLYHYDGNANITNITDALSGHYVMTYGPRNERTLERNQDNFEWQYTYDQLLRLKTQRDPNLTLRTRKYDPAGRVTSHTLSTGREDTYAYDDNDNLRVITRRVNGVAVATTSLTYDVLDRATRVVDPDSQSVDYGFDALSRITSITYPGNRTLPNRYDVLSRLTNQVDWAARQMNYTYDKAGRLIRRAYPNGVVQTNTFDSAGRLTSLAHSTLNPQPSTNGQPSTINIALAYAYDRNGNKTGNSERGTLAWPMPSLVDETSGFTASGRITNRVDALNPATNNFTYQYDASGNMTNAFGGGQSWALKYDEDNRVTSLGWDCGITHKDITNRYDALGRRISRKVDNIETRYVLDLSGSMERILCDTTASGQITAWYIHGLDLSYRVDASNNIICYHADAQANIIAVTDAGGTNAAQYAYTPYGRSLSSTNCQQELTQLSANPFLFVGSQGVMEELPGLYFMRARYYSAETGVFLSTDPVKKIGPGWKPEAYVYVNGNPQGAIDPRGEYLLTLAAEAYHALNTSYKLLAGEERPGKAIAKEIVGEIRGRIANKAIPGFGDALSIVDVAHEIYDDASKDQGLPAAILNLYLKGIYATGDAIGGVLYNKFGVGAVSGGTTHSSPTAGTTPMARLPSTSSQLQPVSFSLGGTSGSGNSSFLSNQTASVAGPKASGTTAGTSTKPSDASSGGSTSSGGSSGSSGSVSYTVKPGDTLGNIGYKYGSSATAIGAANNIQNLNLIRPGQVLTIPGRR